MTFYTQALAELAPSQAETIAAHTLSNGEKVWIRKVGKTVPEWRYKLLGGIASGLRLGALQPVPNPGGRASLAIEAHRLRDLAASGVKVPQLLAKSDSALMFSNVGSDTILSEVENDDDQVGIWQEGLAAIAGVHAQQQYLSQAFARNMIRADDGSISFIDFEDDPGKYMPLVLCQVRDYLCYLQSTAMWIYRRQNLGQAAAVWQQHQAGLPAEIRSQLQQTTRRAQWLRHLKYKWMGNDTLRLSALGKLFYLAEYPEAR
ncbi:MAG: hypothetical protein Q4C79_05835 [Neisseria sp.]|uniref:hypothetical protein n=1 Tax=Neisseria sp. TaxID=192066 RepID=UPI0026DAE68C|nr:hypothetical protein [Neisseria sp.]MDO4248465.1 hypothetical protein [Neisseria sp.]